MSVRIDGDVIYLEGPCRVEDAEPLLIGLQRGAGRLVDVGAAEALHLAVVQILVAIAPPLRGAIDDPVARDLLASGAPTRTVE